MNRKKTATGPDRNWKRPDRSCSCLAFVKLLVAVASNLGQKKKPDATGFNRLQPALPGVQNRHQMSARCATISLKTSPKTPFFVIFKDFFEIFDFL